MHTINTPKEFPSDNQEHLNTSNTSQTSKMSKLLSVATLIAASLTACTTQNQKSDTAPVPTSNNSSTTKKSDSAPTHSSEDQFAPMTDRPPRRDGPVTIDDNQLSYEEWTKRENMHSITLKSHNRGNIVDLGVFQEQTGQLHAFTVKDRTEAPTYRYAKTPAQCDKICINNYTRQLGQMQAAVFEDPFCETANTTYGTLAGDYMLRAAGVTEITYIDLDGSEQIAPMTTKHVLAQIQPGKTCNDLVKNANTGTGTIRITVAPDVPSKDEFNALNNRVNTIQTQVDTIQQTVERQETLIDNLYLCYNNPQAPLCVEARKAVRHSATDTVKAQQETNPY